MQPLKRALDSYFESLRHALSGSNVIAQYYVLGYLDTNLAFAENTPLPRASPRRLAEVVFDRRQRDFGRTFYPRFWYPLCLLLRLLPCSFIVDYRSRELSFSVPDLRVSLFFPVYNDEATVRSVGERALSMLQGFADVFEILIVDDGSPDRSGQIAEELAREHPGIIFALHHPRNLGYGAAIRTGLSACKYDWICMIDGDSEYEVFDLKKMLSLRDYYLLVIAFRYKKLYSTKRIFISFVYNLILRMLFRTPFRDVSTGIRALHRSVLSDLELTCDSPFIGAELAIKTMLRGYPVERSAFRHFPGRREGLVNDVAKHMANRARHVEGTARDILGALPVATGRSR